jgi:hypothetical protein
MSISKNIAKLTLKLIMNLNLLYQFHIIFIFATLLYLANDLFFKCFILSFLSVGQTFFIEIRMKYFQINSNLFYLKKPQKIIDTFDNCFNFLNNSYLFQSL